mmetsp:Transcript_27653/g.76112  ORF Transcript_27653/g.76112 Transcript_27653/m.76112 type:complete len:86 (-) Transcript_27653:159-416(-)
MDSSFNIGYGIFLPTGKRQGRGVIQGTALQEAPSDNKKIHLKFPTSNKQKIPPNFEARFWHSRSTVQVVQLGVLPIQYTTNPGSW